MVTVGIGLCNRSTKRGCERGTVDFANQDSGKHFFINACSLFEIPYFDAILRQFFCTIENISVNLSVAVSKSIA